jgi:TIM21
MKAYGENSHSRWARNRQIAYELVVLPLIYYSSLHRLDPQNVDHLFMRFYVEGENGKGTVRLEMTKVEHARPMTDIRANMIVSTNIATYLSSSILVCQTSISLTIVPGFAAKRIYLEKPVEDTKSGGSPGNKAGPRKGFLGIQWGYDNSARR